MFRFLEDVPPWAQPVVAGVSVVLAIGLAMAAGGAFNGVSEDPERARFMLECVYDWEVAPSDCREILNGEDPPPARQLDGC